MKPKRYILTRLHNGCEVHYGSTGWTHIRRNAKRYSEAQAIDLAERMTKDRASEVYVQPE